MLPPKPLEQTKPHPVTAPHMPRGEAGALRTPILSCEGHRYGQTEGSSEITGSKSSFYQQNPDRGHASSSGTQQQGSWHRLDAHHDGTLPTSMTRLLVSCLGGPPPIWTRDLSSPSPPHTGLPPCLYQRHPLSQQCPSLPFSIYPNPSDPPKSTPDLTHALQEALPQVQTSGPFPALG